MANAPAHDAELLALVVQTQRAVASVRRDPERVMRLVCERAQRATRAAGAVVELADGPDMVYRCASGAAEAFVGLRIAAAGSLSGLSVARNRVLRCDDALRDPRVDRDACARVGVRSMICVPLRHERRSVGVLKVLSGEARHFSGRDEVSLPLAA